MLIGNHRRRVLGMKVLQFRLLGSYKYSINNGIRLLTRGGVAYSNPQNAAVSEFECVRECFSNDRFW